MERRLLAIASGEIAAAQEQMVALGRKTARERTASILLILARRTPARPVAGGELVPVPMSRGEIADYLGLTTETVSRAFRDFRASRSSGCAARARSSSLTVRRSRRSRPAEAP